MNEYGAYTKPPGSDSAPRLIQHAAPRLVFQGKKAIYSKP